jgi:hypothetical protein
MQASCTLSSAGNVKRDVNQAATEHASLRVGARTQLLREHASPTLQCGKSTFMPQCLQGCLAKPASRDGARRSAAT